MPDRRGRGATGDTENDALDREIEDVEAVVDAVDADWLFGHSFGGLVALEAAPELDLEKLVCFEPSILVDEHREGADAVGGWQSSWTAESARPRWSWHWAR